MNCHACPEALLVAFVMLTTSLGTVLPYATSPWTSGKYVRFGAIRSIVRLLAGSYLVTWYCGLLTGRTVCGRSAGSTPDHKNKPSETTDAWQQLGGTSMVIFICQGFYQMTISEGKMIALHPGDNSRDKMIATCCCF